MRQLKIFIPIFLAAVIASNIFAVIILFDEIRDVQDQLISEQIQLLAYSKDDIDNKFDQILIDLDVLTSHVELTEFINNDLETYETHHLEQEFLGFSKAQATYDQIRLLDLNGNEIIRINHNGQTAEIIPKNDLQNKRDRYYFQEAIELNEGEIYISPLDLNIENGVIEEPYKPMIRFATPLYDDLGQKKAILVLNYLGQEIINSSEAFYAFNGDQKFLMTNETGYWLAGLNNEDEWSFMFTEKEPILFQDSFPEVWQQRGFFGILNSRSENSYFANRYTNAWRYMQENKIGHFKTATGYFSFLSVQPANNSSLTWNIFAYQPAETWNSNLALRLKDNIELLLASWILFALMGWLFAQCYSHERKCRPCKK